MEKWITDMSLEQSLTADIVTAMKAKDQNRLTALRMLKTALTNKSIEKGRALEARLSTVQRACIARAYREAGGEAVAGFRKVLLGILNADDRKRFERGA